MAKAKVKACCPECGKVMRWDPVVGCWDCGPEDEGGHGFWDPSDNLVTVEVPDDPFEGLEGL